MKQVLLIVVIFLVWRVLLFFPFWYGHTYIPEAKDSFQYTLWAYAGPYPPVSNFFLYPWSNFDGVHYLTIAGDGGEFNPPGYQHASDGRFFPFYPILIAITTMLIGRGLVFGSQVFFSAFFLSNIFFLLSLIVLYKLIRFDYSPKIAWTTIIFLLCFPVSFFFGAIYTESLFLFLSVTIFYCIRKNVLLLASLLSFFLIATRITGVMILPIILYYLWKDEYVRLFIKKERVSFVKVFVKTLFTFFIPSSLLAFGFYSWHFWNDPLFFVHAQQLVGSGRSSTFVLFPQTVYRYVKILLFTQHFIFPWYVALLELASFLFAAVFLYIAYKKGVKKNYLIFTTLMFLMASGTGTFSGLPRYTIVLFPAFLGLALTNNRYVKIVYVIVSLFSLFFFTAIFSRGYFVS